jgi:O-glycosyl hydrolase
VNEPEWGWCQSGGQEGNPYKNAETAGLVRALNKKLEENKLTTQIQIPESGLLVFANPGWYKFKPGRQNEINNFFNKKKENFLGNETLVAKQVCAHSYFTEWPLWIMRSVRKRTARTAEKRGLEYWMTEYCILRTTKEIQGGGRDLGMHTALYIARVIHHDLVYGNASTWSMWLGVSTADYKDGLVYANKEGTEIVDSKLLWVMGNYSHFIQPGAKRIQIKGKRDKNFFISAFKNEKSNEIVLVVINKMNSLQNINFSDLPEGMLSAYETSAKNNLKNIGEFRSNETIGVAPESVTTFVLKKK